MQGYFLNCFNNNSQIGCRIINGCKISKKNPMKGEGE